MLHVRHTLSGAPRRLASRQVSLRLSQSTRRTYSTPPAEPSRVGSYYKSFGSPVLKCFLGALFTYQLAYYAWLKLEAVEEAHEKQGEISALQGEVRNAVAAQRQNAGEVVGRVGEKVEQVKERVVEGVEEVGRTTEAVKNVAKGGWWPW